MADNKQEKKSGGISIKSLIVGIPLFIIQVFAVYYITANVLINNHDISPGTDKAVKQTEHSEGHDQQDGGHEVEREEHGDYEGEEYKPEQKLEDENGYYQPPVSNLGEHIFAIDDIIVNPAGTNGKRLLLTSIGLDVPNEVQLGELEKKEILVKDLIVSILSSKTLGELKDTAKKDSLKKEISTSLGKLIRKVRINRVYFSKYIIQ